MRTTQKLIALVMAIAIVIACSFATAQDTLDVYEFKTLNIHTDSTQSIVAPEGEIYLYTDANGFYITTACVYDQILCSGCMAYYNSSNNYYFIVPVARQISISFGGETFKINIRQELEQ